MVIGVPGGCAKGLNGLRAFCGGPVFSPKPLAEPPLTLLELIGGGGTCCGALYGLAGGAYAEPGSAGIGEWTGAAEYVHVEGGEPGGG